MAGQEKTLEKKGQTKNGMVRMTFVAIAIMLEIAFLVLIFMSRLWRYAEAVALVGRILAFFLVLGIYSQNKTASIKMPWIILILVFPLLGVALYLTIGLSGSTARMRKRYEDVDKQLMPLLVQDDEVMSSLEKGHYACANVARYIQHESGYPVCKNTKVTYYDDASKGLEAQKLAMKEAKRFIFMEYFAIENAKSWRGIEDILVEKAKEGLDVRVFYDDLGSIGFINSDFARNLEKKGIHCRVFNPMIPIFNLFLNNRDHRKMTIIDGEIGFTGGYNIADEYFNITSPYGHWKDTGIRLEGDAVISMTITFLEMWNAVRKDDKDDKNIAPFLKENSAAEQDHGIEAGQSLALPAADEGLSTESTENCGAETDSFAETGNTKSVIAQSCGAETDSAQKDAAEAANSESGTESAEDPDTGYVQFYADNPMDKKAVGEDVYMCMVNRAQRYIYFMSPYLIITDEMSRMLGLAAKRGVDVRIITPGIPDKKMVYRLTRSYYSRLAAEGVRIFEYTPGFCHAKMCVSDDIIATCGTINMDYRSLYHHFENGCLMINCNAVTDIREDMESTMEQCEEVTERYRSGRSAALRFGQLVLRLFAPLM